MQQFKTKFYALSQKSTQTAKQNKNSNEAEEKKNRIFAIIETILPKIIY